MGVFRFIGWLSAAALVVVIALFAWLAIDFHFRAESPDVGSVARSQPVVEHDHAAVSRMSSGLNAVASAAGVVQGPMAVADYCASDRGFGFTPSWQPTLCQRTVSAYFFSNSSIQQTTAAWVAALHAARWTVLEVNTGPFVSGATAGGSLTIYIRWLDRPLRATRLLPADDPEMSPGSAVAWIQHSAVPRGAAASATYAQYSNVAEVTLSTTYYDAANPDPTPTPTASGGAQYVCISGSGTCN